MKDQLQWFLTLGVCALVLAICLQMPQWRHIQDERFQGIAIPLSSDEDIYLARVQEALSGRPEQSAEAFTGHANLQGTQFAMLERLYGSLFRFTGLRAAGVLTMLDVFIPVLIFLSLVYAFTLFGFEKRVALLLAVGFCALQLYSLNRPIHMRSSFLIMLWSIICIQLSVLRHQNYFVLAGALLGLLVGMYVWSFMFAWAFWGVYLLWEFIEWVHARYKQTHASRLKRLLWYFRPRKPLLKGTRWQILALCGVTGLMVALPFIAKYIALHVHPLYEYGSFRSGMHPGHLPESLPYSGLFLAAAVCVGIALRQGYETLRPYRAVFALLLAACIYMNQQVVHGITFNFVSHGIFSMMLAAIAVVGLAIVRRDVWLRIGAVFLAVYIAAIAYDGRVVWKQWHVSAASFASQHLAEALPVLDELPRGRFVSDADTMAIIAGYTHHDIVYSIYLKNVLMSHYEIALRYCLTQIPVEQEDRNFAAKRHLVMPDAVSAFKGDTRATELALVESACREVDAAPNLALEVHEISHILWDKKRNPNWNLSRFAVNLEEVESTETWAIYRISP